MSKMNAVTSARYEAGTKTIRSVPENYWLASMDSWDGAVDHEANAHVFAAAFQMKAALRAILFQVAQGKVFERDACIAQARDAYAKAGGPSAP